MQQQQSRHVAECVVCVCSPDWKRLDVCLSLLTYSSTLVSDSIQSWNLTRNVATLKHSSTTVNTILKLHNKCCLQSFLSHCESNLETCLLLVVSKPLCTVSNAPGYSTRSRPIAINNWRFFFFDRRGPCTTWTRVVGQSVRQAALAGLQLCQGISFGGSIGSKTHPNILCLRLENKYPC